MRSRRTSSRSQPASRRVLRLSSLAVVAVAALGTTSACTSRAGAAAVVGGDRIEISTLHGMTVRGTNSGSLQTFNGADGLQRRELTLLVRRDLVSSLAKRLGVAVTAGQVAAVGRNFASQAGGQKAFEQQAEQSGVSTQDLPTVLHDEALGEAITAKLSRDPANGDAAYAQALQQEAKRIGVHISPRFGQWDPSTVAVVAATDDLSTPSKGGSSGAGTSSLGQ